MKKTIKAILIDAENRQIKEVELQSTEGYGFNESIYKELKCDYITSACGDLFNRLSHALFVDDEGLLKNEPMGAFCIRIGETGHLYESQVLSGNGIIVGVDEEGECIDHALDVEIIKDIVKWDEVANLPAPSMTFIPLND
jgi:hypothetical protein